MRMIHFLRMVLLAVIMVAAASPAQGILDPVLQRDMLADSGPYQVIVTFTDPSEVQRIGTLGVAYLPLTVLPMCGAVLTRDQITTVLSWDKVASVYANSTLEYFNHDAGAMTGAHTVQSVMGFQGKGTTIVILDSGIDANHPDLAFRDKVVENVKIVGDLGVTGTTAFVEGVINTDNTSGHGTHVAGTAAGTGAASLADERDAAYYRGVAPEATLVGLGAGETLLILHALIGFDYAIATKDRFGTTVISNSWGNSTSRFDPNNPISVASYEAYRRGVVVTFAAGNDGPDDNTMSTYAINPWVIGVASGTKARSLSDFSSRGEQGDPFEHPDITAPGQSITSTRAPGTPVGALGPVVNALHPEYTLYYHTISGTSMATPFVSGAAALMVEANPYLSPDQIEEILVSTADPMPGYQMHQVGGGYINVLAAVEQALVTQGNMISFLSGDTKWSSQGTWTVLEEQHDHISTFGLWKVVSDPSASDGAYLVGEVKMKGKKSTEKPLLRTQFFGTTVKISYPTNSKGGAAEVVIDGVSRGVVNFYSDLPQWDVRSAFAGLPSAPHTLELRGLTGRTYVDRIFIDGRSFPASVEFVSHTTEYSGTMGPSVEGIPETQTITFGVNPEDFQISATLSWSGGVDIDLYLLDPNGEQVASSASLDNPEALSYWVSQAGTYTYKIVGYATVAAEYTLASTITRAEEAAPSVAARRELPSGPSVVPKTVTLGQNYPNPFNPVTRIRYELPQGQHVRLTVYNVLGVEVATLVDGFQPSGEHTVRFDAKRLASGVFFYKLETRDAVKMRKMIVLK